MPKPMILLLLSCFGCVYITDEEHLERQDLDGDGLTGDVDCDDDDAAVGESSEWYPDGDGDGFGANVPVFSCEALSGYVAEDGDCDDEDADSYPGADELCDEADNDCDGQIDEEGALDPSTWYADADGDGYGAEDATAQACQAPSGYVAEDGDCDDEDADSNPGADEDPCDGVDNDCDEEVDEHEDAVLVSWYVDGDGDDYGDPKGLVELPEECSQPEGYVADNSDCDDDDAAINPGADELCDEADNDCDGLTDDQDDDVADGATWYGDGDADGYGLDKDTTQACEQPKGYGAEGGDCDDGDGAVNPGAEEVCDGADNDCDGLADDDDKDVVSDTTWYADGDGDEYGAGKGISSCDQPKGYVDDGTDCDDGDGAVNPGALEYCNGYDDDCDGAADEAGAEDESAWYYDGDGDSYGDAAFTLVQCSQPSLYVSDGSDCDDGDAGINPGAAEDCLDGLDNDCSGVVDDCALSAADLALYGPAAGAECAPAAAGDSDGDGLNDLLVGCPGDSGTGAVYLLLGPASGATLAGADAQLQGEAPGDLAGQALASGDVDGDGYADLLVGAPGRDPANTGVAYLHYGPLSSGSLGDGLTMEGSDPGDGAGEAVHIAGDVDGDGNHDLLVGAAGSDYVGADSGMAYLLFGPASPASALSAADALLVSEAAGDELGYALASGDLDGDGSRDVLVGAPGEAGDGTAAGAAYVVYGPFAGMTLLATADAKLVGESDGDRAGCALSAAGDVDGDGYDDLLVGADQADGALGMAYLLLGAPSGTVSLSSSDASFEGDGAGDELGAALAIVGDVNGDGPADFLLGVPGLDDGGTAAGAAYLVLGPATGSTSLSDADAMLTGEAAGDEAGGQLGGAGDVDGDGFDDLLVGAAGNDSVAAEAGAVYLFVGSSF